MTASLGGSFAGSELVSRFMPGLFPNLFGVFPLRDRGLGSVGSSPPLFLMIQSTL